MTASTAALAASTPKYGRLFFENLWRMSGVQAVAFFVVGTLVAGFGPGTGASPEALQAYFVGNSTRILIATPILGLGILNLVWWAQALRTTLAESGQDGWGAAATAASSMVGAIAFGLVALRAALAYSVAGSAGSEIASALNDLGWAGFVLSSFPRAMLVMSGTFGFWRAGMISNRSFLLGVAVVLLGVLGGTTWVGGGFWGVDGLFSAVIWPVIGLVWVVAASRVLNQAPSTRTGF